MKAWVLQSRLGVGIASMPDAKRSDRRQITTVLRVLLLIGCAVLLSVGRVAAQQPTGAPGQPGTDLFGDDNIFGDSLLTPEQSPTESGLEPVPQIEPRNEIEELARITNQEVIEPYQQGVELAEAGRYFEAIAKFNEARKLDAKFAAIYFELAKAYMAVEDYDNAQLNLRTVPSALGVSQYEVPQIYFLTQADLSLAQKNWSDAASMLEAASQLDYTDPEAAMKLGYAHLLESLNGRGGRSAEQALTQAVTALDRAIELKPDYAEAYMQRGRAYAVQSGSQGPDRLDDAIDDFRQALSIDPELKNATSHLGRTLYMRGYGEYRKKFGDMAKAVADLKDATASFQMYVDHLEGTTTKQQREEAAEDRQPDEMSLSTAYSNLANTLMLVGSEAAGEEASGYFRQAAMKANRAIEESPDDAETYYYLGLAQRMVDEYPQAIESLSHSIALTPAAETYIRRGICFYRMGDVGRAAADLKQALAFQPDPRAYFWLGVVEADRGNDSAAIWYYTSALRLTQLNNYVLAYINRGISLWKLGRYEQADADFSEALTRDPENARAKALQERLRAARRQLSRS